MTTSKFLAILFLCVGVVVAGCEKKEEITPQETPPAVMELSVVEGVTFYAENSEIYLNPVVTFNYGVMKEMILGSNLPYRINVVSIELLYSNKSLSLLERGQFSENGRSFSVDVPEVSAPGTELVLRVTTIWEQRIAGIWQPVTYQNETVGEQRDFALTVLTPSTLLPAENILATYPVINQFNFHWQEYAKGYILLNRDQNWWKSGAEGGQLYVLLANNSGYSEKIDVLYEPEKSLFSFNMPADLRAETVYSLTYVYEENGSIRELLSTHFRTSKFSTFADKVNALVDVNNGWLRPLYDGVDEIGKTGRSAESFAPEDITLEKMAIFSSDKTTDIQVGLVRLKAIMEGNKYFEEFMYPTVYEPFDPAVFTPNVRQPTKHLGYPPVEAMHLRQSATTTPSLTAAHIEAGTVPSQEAEFAYIHRVQQYFVSDYMRLRSIVASHVYNHGDAILNDERVRRIHEARWRVYPEGEYKYTISYQLPGIDAITFSKELSMWQPVKSW
jgi:hypothetical protein